MKTTSNEPKHQQERRLLDWEATKRIAAFLREPVEPAVSDDLPRMNDYEVYEHLGTGGSGSVYMAIPKAQPETVVAVKLFRLSPGTSAPSPRMLRELDLLSVLTLPCIPRIHNYGTDQGRFFIATDVVRGTRIDRYCEERSLDREERVILLIEVASAVQQLHEVGVIHRDLKPSNIMIRRDGAPVLIDLGIATMLEADEGETITSDGAPIGTPGFMSPEQARGERTATTIRSDIYSLGATACSLLTGKTPHDASGALHEVIRRVADDPPRHPQQLDPSMPKALAAILAKAIARKPKDRFASAGEFAALLKKFLEGEPIAIASPSIFSRASFRIRRNPWLTATSALAALAFFAAVFFGFAAVAESRLADEQAELAQEQSELAEARRAFAAEKEQFARSANEHLQRVRQIVARFITKAEEEAAAGAFGEALALIYAIDHLLAPDRSIDPALAGRHQEMRTTIIIDALHQIYRTDEFGGGERVESLRNDLSELEQQRMENQLSAQ